MISLPTRSRQILSYLLERDRPTQIRELAELLLVSPRTVRYDLDHLRYWLKERGLGLITRPRVGVWLAGDKQTRETLRREIGVREPQRMVLKPAERQDFLLLELLRASGPVSAEKLAKRVGVSRTTVFKDLKQVEPFLLAHGLSIRRRLHRGIEIVGSELARRETLVNLIIEYAGEAELTHFLQTALLQYDRKNPTDERFKPAVTSNRRETNAETAGYLQELFGKAQLRDVEEIVDLAQDELGVVFADSSYIALIVHLVIAIDRLRERKAIIMPLEQLQKLKELPEFTIAKRAAQRLGERLGLEIPEAEAGYITLHLLGGQVRAKVDSSTGGSFSKDAGSLAHCIDRMIFKAGSVLGVDLTTDRQLFEGLKLHLERALNRLKFGLANHNPLREEIKANYPLAFRAAREACSELESLTGIVVDEDTVSFVAMHFGASAERVKNCRKKRVLVVCSTGVGSARLLAARLLQEFPEIELEGTVSVREAETACDKTHPDLVVSTVPLNLQGPPVINVSPLVTKGEVYKVEQALRGANRTAKAPDSDLPARLVEDLMEIISRQAEVKDREVLREELDKYLQGALIHRIFDGSGPGPSNACRSSGAQIADGDTWAGRPDPAVLEATRKMVKRMEQELDLFWDETILLGLAVHLDLARERWKRGERFVEPELDLYRKRYPGVFETVNQHLRQLAQEIGAEFDQNEVVPVLHYLFYQKKEKGDLQDTGERGR